MSWKSCRRSEILHSSHYWSWPPLYFISLPPYISRMCNYHSWSGVLCCWTCSAVLLSVLCCAVERAPLLDGTAVMFVSPGSHADDNSLSSAIIHVCCVFLVFTRVCRVLLSCLHVYRVLSLCLHVCRVLLSSSRPAVFYHANCSAPCEKIIACPLCRQLRICFRCDVKKRKLTKQRPSLDISHIVSTRSKSKCQNPFILNPVNSDCRASQL